MTITYETGNGLYINLTNRCNNNCEFCVRQTKDGNYGDLWLDREPGADEVVSDIKKRELSKYKEIVFCGYGEPTLRLDVMLEIITRIKKFCSLPVRLNTNGLANLLYKTDVTPRFAGMFDTVSISLNTADAASYNALCHPEYGEAAYPAILEFAGLVKKYVPKTVLTVVDKTISDEDIEKCKKAAEAVGVTLRVREFIG